MKNPNILVNYASHLLEYFWNQFNNSSI